MTDIVLEYLRSFGLFGCSRYGSRVVPEAAKLRIEEAGPRKRMWSVTRPQLIAVLRQLHDLFPEFLRIGLVPCLFVHCLSVPSTHQFSSMLPCSSHATSSVHEMGVTPALQSRFKDIQYIYIRRISHGR